MIIDILDEIGAVSIHGYCEPPRGLLVKFWNPVLGANFDEYRIESKQAWEGRPGHGDVEVITSTNGDPLLGDGRYKRIGGVFYSLSGQYRYEYYEEFRAKLLGPVVAIGDFNTLGAALSVLEGMGVITAKDRQKIQDATGGMENAR